MDPSIAADQTVFTDISRTFMYTIVRENGRIGDILVNVVTTYNQVREPHDTLLLAIKTYER